MELLVPSPLIRHFEIRHFDIRQSSFLFVFSNELPIPSPAQIPAGRQILALFELGRRFADAAPVDARLRRGRARFMSHRILLRILRVIQTLMTNDEFRNDE